MPFDTLIKNATVVDGTNSPQYWADIGLQDGKIAAIGTLGEAEAGRTIDAAGLVLAPGFIDMHTHSDLTLLDDPGGGEHGLPGSHDTGYGELQLLALPDGRTRAGAATEDHGGDIRDTTGMALEHARRVGEHHGVAGRQHQRRAAGGEHAPARCLQRPGQPSGHTRRA